MNKELNDLVFEIQEHCFFLLDTDVPVLLRNGWGGLPVLVRRNLGRDIVLLKDLNTYLAKPMAENDHLRDVSTWPEDIDAMWDGRTPPHSTKFFGYSV